MKDDVLIKSNKYGITIYFNSDNSFEELLDDVKNKITGIRGNAVVCNLLNAHELLGGLPPLVFLLFFHVGSSHSKICCSVM